MRHTQTGQFKRCIFFLVDGARPDVLEERVRQGHLPHIRNVFFENGEARVASTAFPSTTGPAYVPFLTGCFPGTCNLPGIRWMDREAFARTRWSMESVRSYVGFESFLMGRDLAPHLKTLFDLLAPSQNVFSMIYRGLSPGGNQGRFARPLYYLYGHYTGDWSAVDRKATRLLLKAIDQDPKFIFVVLPGVDEHSHLSNPFSARVQRAYRDFDRAVELLVKKLTAKGWLDSTLLMAASDHGLSATHTHLELWKVLDEAGHHTLYYPRIFRRFVDAACMVSGNAMAHVYLKNTQGWESVTYHKEVKTRGLLERLLNRVEVDQVVTREMDGGLVISSQKGQARLRADGTHLIYEVNRSDPFGFPSLPRKMSWTESLEKTIQTDYPDALAQLAQIFRSRRSGDVIVTAKPGYDLRARHEHPQHHSSHGSLHRSHMVVPLLSSAKLKREGTARTVDVFPTILDFLGCPKPDYPIDGRSLVEG